MLAHTGIEHIREGLAAGMEIGLSRVNEQPDHHACISSAHRKKMKLPPAEKMFESIMGKSVPARKMKLFWEERDIDWQDHGQWQQAGFLKSKFDQLCKDMGRKWTSDYRNVLLYMVDYGIWHARRFNNKVATNKINYKDIPVSLSVVGRIPMRIRRLCEYLHKDYKEKDLCGKCGLIKHSTKKIRLAAEAHGEPPKATCIACHEGEQNQMAKTKPADVWCVAPNCYPCMWD